MKIISDNKKLIIQLFRYVLSGGFAFVVDFGLMVFFTEVLNVNYVLSSAIGFTTGLIITYLLSIFWIFDERRIVKIWKEFIIFAAIGGVGIVINTLILWFATEYLELYYIYSKVLAAGVVVIWNFIAKKYILFTDKK